MMKLELVASYIDKTIAFFERYKNALQWQSQGLACQDDEYIAQLLSGIVFVTWQNTSYCIDELKQNQQELPPVIKMWTYIDLTPRFVKDFFSFGYYAIAGKPRYSEKPLPGTDELRIEKKRDAELFKTASKSYRYLLRAKEMLERQDPNSALLRECHIILGNSAKVFSSLETFKERNLRMPRQKKTWISEEVNYANLMLRVEKARKKLTYNDPNVLNELIDICSEYRTSLVSYPRVTKASESSSNVFNAPLLREQIQDLDDYVSRAQKHGLKSSELLAITRLR